MASYAYTAINAEGLELRGELQAATASAAREQLRVQGLLAEHIEELSGAGADGRVASGDASARSGGRSRGRGVKPRVLQVFSRQFATMIDAGLNVVTALSILEEQTDDPHLAVVIGQVRSDVEGGALLSEALSRHPKIFSRIYVSMVEAGEAAGILDGSPRRSRRRRTSSAASRAPWSTRRWSSPSRSWSWSRCSSSSSRSSRSSTSSSTGSCRS
jgi:type IV pilus assembly protein PilC